VKGVTLDAGALIAYERAARPMDVLVQRAMHYGAPVTVPAGVVAQVWRDGRTQARLARLLAAREVTVVPLDDRVARAAGQLCGLTRTTDIVDASVVLSALERGTVVVTGDPDDLLRLYPRLEVVPI
jgi:hypothetical protein